MLALSKELFYIFIFLGGKIFNYYLKLKHIFVLLLYFLNNYIENQFIFHPNIIFYDKNAYINNEEPITPQKYFFFSINKLIQVRPL